MELMAYCDRVTHLQGSNVDVYASGDAGPVTVDMVRLIRPPDDEASQIPLQSPVPEVVPVEGVVRPQETFVGSYLMVEGLGDHEQGAISGTVFILPTRLSAPDPQVLWWLGSQAETAVELVLEQGVFTLSAGGGRLTSGASLVEGLWHVVTWTVGEKLRLSHRLLRPAPNGLGTWTGSAVAPAALGPIDVMLIGAGRRGAGVGTAPGAPTRGTGFNGKVDSPSLVPRELTAAEVAGDLSEPIGNSGGWAWDFSQQQESSRAVESLQAHHGLLVNCPGRAMTGPTWDGDVHDWRFDRSGHGAVYLHDDDLDDARWDLVATLVLPEALAPGFYGVRVHYANEPAEVGELVSIVVATRKRSRGASVLVLIPTYSYLAYANLLGNGEDLDYEEAGLAVGPVEPHAMMQRLLDHQSLGGSTYDVHSDGSGRSYSSPRRPMWNMRPDWKSGRRDAYRHLAADLYIPTWLSRLEIAYDMSTDHLLNKQGRQLLEGYDVVITGSHPEYTSATEHRALREFTESGGSLLYLGGNGFYWVTSESPDVPEMVEVRRGFNGTRTWTGAPGEGHHSTTGELGGLWRYRGLSPHALLGVGFVAQGADGGGAAFEKADPVPDEAAFLFDGIEGRVFGERGFDMGAAASDEVDRFSIAHGSPPWAHVAGSSQELSHFYKMAVEDIQLSRENNGGDVNRDVRADLVLVRHASGGMTFAASSIGWVQAMAVDDFDNSVARITENALRATLSRKL